MKRFFHLPIRPAVLLPALPALLLPLAAVPFAAVPLHAQATTGTSHPEQLIDPVETDHYVKPTHAGGTGPSDTTPPPAPAYQDSFPATSAEPQPQLLTREQPAMQPTAAPGGSGKPASPSAPLAASVGASTSPAGTSDDDIVLAAPSRPGEIGRGTVLHARLQDDLSTRTTAENSTFTAELVDSIQRDGAVLLPAGSLIRGRLTSVRGGSRISGGASMHLRPESVALPNGAQYRLAAQVTDLNSAQDLRVNQEGTIVLRSHPKQAAAVVGGVTAAGAVTGALVGAGVGAAVGAVAGAGVATAVYLKRDVQEDLPAGTEIYFALDEPLATAVAR